MRARILLILVAVAPLIAQPAPTASRYASAADRAIAAVAERLPSITAAAEASADRVVDGGSVYIAGPMKGFDLEGYYRAGGFCMVQRIKADTVLADGDVLLLGALGDDEQLAALNAPIEPDLLTIVFGPATAIDRDGVDLVIATGVTGHGEVITLPDNTRIAPLDGVLNVMNLWVYSAELFAAFTRHGKTPTMYQSVMVEGARDRNARVREQPFHDDLSVEPIPPGHLGRAYINGIRNHLQHLREPAQIDAVARAVDLAVTAAQSGHARYAWMLGHYLPSVLGTPGDPGGWTMLSGQGPDVVKDKVAAGDVVVYVGYTWMEAEAFAVAREAGAKSVAVVAGTSDAPPPDGDSADVRIDPGWIFGDAELTVEGYDVRILPPSGVVQTVVYWMIVAETARRLAG